MKIHSSQKGVTILELLLILAIMSSVLIMGFNLYNQFSLQARQARLLGNVDQLFQAMAKYYQVNCRLRYDINNNPVSPGALDPATSPPSQKVLNIATDLVNPGFLSGWQPNNPLVDNTPTEKGYYVQFNRATDQTMNVYACTGPGAAPSYAPACTANPQTTALSASRVVVWRMQVAVKLFDPAKQTPFDKQMNATCISTAASASGPVTMCEASPAANGYLVWERPATYISKNTSDFWLLQPIIKQFNMQYTNDSMQLLNGTAQSFPSGGGSQYYLCGE